MRMSVMEGEAGYGQHCASRDSGKRIRVFIDGAEVGEAISLDDEKGWVRRYKTDADGHYVVDETGESLVVETLTGAVRVIFGDA